jgi:chromosome partitioning protein
MTAAIIVVAQRKGGAGKTTLAAHLGTTWAAQGYGVTLIDTDSQASLARWYQRRKARLNGCGSGLDFAAAVSWRALGEIRTRARDCDILLVDSPASIDVDVRIVMRHAGLVLVPVQPSPLDVWASVPTLEMAKSERVPALLVLNRVPARSSLTGSMRVALGEYDVGLAATSLGNRVALAAALAEGWGITECAADSAAAQEIGALATELLGLLPAAQRPPLRREASEEPLLLDRPVFAVEKSPFGGAIAWESRARGTGETTDGLGVMEPAIPTADQLRAGIASLKRRLARRPK